MRRMMNDPEPQKAMLQGMRVIDMTSVVFGPYATQVLAELGAEVIKVEAPGGDVFRQAGRPAATPGMGPCHLGLNRGKASICLDLTAEADRATLRALLQTADIFIHNVRAAGIERLGFGFEAVREIRPDIIYVHCVGFGSDGPYAERQAYDDVIQAASGTTSLLGRVDGDPRPRYLHSLIADKVAGLHAVYATLAAVIHRLRTGEGQRVEVPMFEAFTSFMLKEHLYGATLSPQLEPIGYPRQLEPNRQPFPTRDGHIAIVPYTDGSIVRLLHELGGGEMLDDPAFDAPAKRQARTSEIYRRIGELTPARTTSDWCERLHRAGIPAMPTRDLADITDDPHLVETGFFVREPHPTEGDYIHTRHPIRFGATGPFELRPAPLLDGDGDAIRNGLETRIQNIARKD
jgi:crotonobetainyl-CoA:carnitine CoA-transferase CaiB-like acyl-CoA transferase